MRIKQLWRYPVKSMGGERLDACQALSSGLVGDRQWGIVDVETGCVLTARREPRLLFAHARLVSPEEPEITLPDGRRGSDDDLLSAWLGRPVSLQRAGATGGIYETPGNFECETDWVSWQGPPVAWHDSGSARVSLVSTATIGGWDVRRFRPNVLLDGRGEDDLVGHSVAVGSAVLAINERINRCVMVTRPQPGLEADIGVLRAINRDRNRVLAIGADVTIPGTMEVGDVVLDLASGSEHRLRM